MHGNVEVGRVFLAARAGFVACADGPAELSRTYKDDLTRSLEKKA